jgi:hypothetical protein
MGTLSCLWIQISGVEAYSFLPDDQDDRCDFACQGQPRHLGLYSFADLSIVKFLERPCLDGGNCRGALEQIFEIVIVILIESANRCLLPGSLQLSIKVLVLCAVVGFDRQPAVSPQLSLGAKAVRGLEQCDGPAVPVRRGHAR